MLGLSQAAPLIRYTRSSMLETVRQDYVRVARSKGLSEQKVIVNHALRNALIPLVTIVALGLAATARRHRHHRADFFMARDGHPGDHGGARA